MKINLLLILCFCSTNIFCQNINPSAVFARTCYNKQECFSFNDNGASFLFYNQESHEFTVIVDFNILKIGNDTLDKWLEDLSGTKLVFKGVLNSENLLILSQHNSKSITVNGTISFNEISTSHSIELTMFELSDKGLLYRNNEQDYYDRLKANLQFSFYPKEFSLHKKEHHLKKTITVLIYNGYINKTSPLTEKLQN